MCSLTNYPHYALWKPENPEATPMPKLNKRIVDAAEAQAAEYFVWDSDIPGFGLRVLPSGRKGYVVQYRAGRRSRRISLGPSTVLTCEQARTRAITIVAAARNGQDPAAERDAGRKAITIKELAERFDKEHIAIRVKATGDDLAEMMKADATDFDWDLVFIDEGQDWPSDEIAILNAIYGPRRLIVSDGVDQYVRASVADWTSNLKKNQSTMHRLKKCLRMKANVASFVADVAIGLGLDDWDLVPNADAPGGRVIIYEGDLALQPGKIVELVGQAHELGNYPVDLLACIPPQSVVRTSGGSGSAAAEAYVLTGGKVWDGTARDVRDHYPTDRQELRFVQYDSCRGLEGWTTVNYDLDQLWDYKVRQWLCPNAPRGPGMHDPIRSFPN
jgi:hypothetical protein